MLADELKIGDKVTYHYDNLWSGKGLQICTVVKITEKRKDIVVTTGKTQMTFDRIGSARNGDAYNRSYITKTTDEDVSEIQNAIAVRKCIRLFEEHRKAEKITAEMAKKIIAIFEEADKTQD